ncbi:MAG: WYL domain-containing transcriptional regulator [Treponema sp.]|nr:WYL domain-containing transcriptional regulator [Candidatus Treponema equi]
MRDNKNNRLKMLVSFIRTLDYPNADLLVEKFRTDAQINLSKVTIYRYIKELNDMGAGIKADMNRFGGGYYLEDKNFWSDKINLTPGEMVGLGLLQSLMKVHKSTPVEHDIASLFDKMSQFMPDGDRYDKSRIAQYIHVITGPTAVIKEGIFNSIIDCVQNHMTFSFSYSKNGSDHPQKYTIDPYRIILSQNGDWYVMGCKNGERTAIRTFAFARISNIEPTGERFTIPADFRIDKHIDPEMGVWATDSYYKVRMVFDKQLAQHAKERKWHHTESFVELEGGNLEVRLTTSQLKDITRIVLSYGSMVKVLEPPELIEDIKAEIRKMGETYGCHQ